MSGLLSQLPTERLGRYFYPLSIGAVLIALAAVQQYLSTRFVIFGLYGLFGLVGGAAVYYRTSDTSNLSYPVINDRMHAVGVYVVTAVSLGLVALTGEPLLVVLGLGLGYALVVRQLVSSPTPGRMVPQITALFLLSPTVKYLTAGQYIGHGDLLVHTRLVEDIMLGGSLEAIASASYNQFPGLQLLSATIASLTGLSAYDGIMLAGLGAYAIVVPAVYLVALRLTDIPVLALSVAFAVTLLDDISFYVSYAFPQSLAMVMVVLLALLATIAERDAVKWPAVAGFGLVAVALSFTHHLTQLLFIPVILCATVVYALSGGTRLRDFAVSRSATLLVGAVLITTVRLLLTGFFGRLWRAGGLLVQGGLYGGYTQGLTREFGAESSTTVLSAVQWLTSAYGLYIILLLMVFSVGVVGLLRATNSPPAYTALAWTGVIGAVLVFETPLSIPSLIRIRAPWLFAFAFVVGLGIYQFRRDISSTGSLRLLFMVLIVLAAIGPLVTADNYYDLDPRETAQTSFSAAEYEQLRGTASFVDATAEPTTVFWETRLVMDRYRISEDLPRASVRDDQVRIPAGHYVYRDAWADHRLTFTAASGDEFYSNTVYMSDEWLDQRVDAGNQVYSAGGTGILWQPTERPLDNNGGLPAANSTAS